MSAPKMGEYLEASANRRERILRDQKFPPTFKQILYENARKAIRKPLCDGGADVPARLERFATRIEALAAPSSYQRDANQCSALAVRRFAALYPSLSIAAISCSTPANALRLDVESVAISIAPDVLLSREVRGVLHVGALLTVMRKGEALGDRSGKAIAELLRHALTDAGHQVVQPEMCLVVDLFRGTVWTAQKRGGQRIWDDIASACREIAAIWPTLRTERAA